MLNNLKSDLNKLKNPAQAKNLQWFFKTGPGEYGEGDIFLGLKMAQTRQLVKKYFRDINFDDIQKLLNSKIHEYRMAGVLILVEKYKKVPFVIPAKAGIQGNKKKLDPGSMSGMTKEDIYNFYLKNTKNINNWDLVDLSAPNIVGDYLLTRFSGDLAKASKNSREILYKLAKSKNLWERRIAVLATAAFIRQNDFSAKGGCASGAKDALKIYEMLLTDKHDLIHKAVGWMLREIGKQDGKTLLKFLNKYTLKMPRTMLRYSIERLPEKKRKAYLTKK